MVRERRKTVIRPNGKFYAFIGVVAAAVVAIVFLVTNIQTATVEFGELQFETEVPIVIVRDEQVVTEENYGRANYIVQEGTRVEADSPVAEVFKWGYNEKISYELLEKQTSIQEYQENAILQDVEDANLAGINQSIREKAEDINGIIRTGTGDILVAERELKELMRQKREYLNDTVTADRKLEEFFSEEQQLQERVDSASEVVNAPQAGVVSYYFDGAEDVLNAENLQEITSADINDILNGTTAVQNAAAGTEAQQGAQPLYRLVNNFKWYILIDMDEAMKEFAQGNTFQIAFDDFLSRQYEGTVVGHVAEETGYIYVIEVLDDIGELLSTRRTDARVFTKFEGLKVPEEAIQTKNGETGVTVVNGRDKTFVPVEVQIVKDGSAIISPMDEQSALGSNVKVEV